MLVSLEILRRMREAGYQGGKTALYDLVVSLRPEPAKTLVRFEGLPGEFSQHDFVEVEVEFLNGTRRHIHFFFASRLKYSRRVRVSLVQDEKVETFSMENVRTFKPDVTIDRPTEMKVRGTRIELIPVQGGETHDAMFIHLPDQGVLFVGDFTMPYVGAPFVEEGDFQELLEGIDIVVEIPIAGIA